MIQYFLLGVFTVYIALPIIDSILAVILSLLELFKGYLALKLSIINQEIQDIKPKPTTRAIGFTADIIEKEAEECDSEA